MKRILLASTAAAALVGGVSAASAAEWSAGVSGFMQIGVGFADGEDGPGVLRDGEIHFNSKLVADNGITFDGRVELEATTTSDQIDENWARVGGSFGSIKVGGDDSAKGAYANGVIYSPGSRVGYFDAFGITQNNAMGFISGNGDSIGIHYDSPSFSGFSFGASYIPNGSTDGAGDTGDPAFSNDAAGDDFWSVGGMYDGNFGDFGFGVSAAYGDSDGASEIWHVGGNVSFSGFTVAAHYEDDGDDMYAIGASYGTGPWTVAGGYALDEVAGGADGEVWSGWVSYAIAPGVSGTVGLEYHDDGVGNADEEIAGLAYLQLNF
ncbi:MAG: porin [Pseudomonadota bacterium]